MLKFKIMNILIVDDEIRAVNALIKRVDWESHGFAQPFSAYSMAQAQDVFKAHPVDLMLCDIEMPQGNGLELFEWVKSYYPRTECIFVTCHDEYEYLRAAMQLGSCDYILKPVNYDQLKDALDNVRTRISARISPEATVSDTDKRAQALSEVNSSSNPYISGAMEYIAVHLTQPMSVPEIADAVHLNEQYLMRLFKKETGSSILQYITSQRIALSVEYLKNTDLPVTEVALNSGFDNYSYFNRIFKRFTGETPSKFRKPAGSSFSPSR